MNKYEKAAASARTIRAVINESIDSFNQVLSPSELDKLCAWIRTFDRICIEAEDRMFRECPELSGAYAGIFNGSEPSKEILRHILGE